MITKKTNIMKTILAITLMISSNALATEVTNQSLSNGLYTDLYFGYGYVATTKGSHGVTGGGTLGYKLTDFWSIEGGFSPFSNTGTTTYYFYGALKRRLFSIHAWKLFGKIGPAVVKGARNPDSDTTSKFTGYFGLGTTYWLQPNLGFILQSGLTVGRDTVPLTFALTAGISYFF